MNFVYLKILYVTNIFMQCWTTVIASPVAMLQHATSSQSIVFHQTPEHGAVANAASAQSNLGQFNDNHPKYEYKYEVSDHQTGDRKSHWETRDGDRVRGVYTVYEPDGALRRVEYTADSAHGFNAVVTRNGQSKHHGYSHASTFNSDSNSRVAKEGYDYSSVNQPNYSHDRSLSINGRSEDELESPGFSSSNKNSGIGYSVNHVSDLKGRNHLL